MTKSSSPRYESYFDIHCRPNLTPTGIFKEPGKCQERRHSAHRFIGPYRLHTFCARRCVNHMLLCFSVLTPLIYAGYFVFAAFASAFMLKARDLPFYCPILARVSDFAFACSFCAQNVRGSLHRGSKQRSIESLTASLIPLDLRKYRLMNATPRSCTRAS